MGSGKLLSYMRWYKDKYRGARLNPNRENLIYLLLSTPSIWFVFSVWIQKLFFGQQACLPTCHHVRNKQLTIKSLTMPWAKRQLNDFSSFLIQGEIYAMSKNAKLDSEKWKVNTPQRYSSSFIRRKHLRVEASWKMTHRSILILTLPLGSHVMRLLQVTNWSGPFTRLLVSSSITMLCSTSEKKGLILFDTLRMFMTRLTAHKFVHASLLMSR